MSNVKTMAVNQSGQVAAINPMQMVQLAVEQGADIDKLEKLMALQERWEANEARKAFFSAMAEFKANAPTLVKNAHVSYGTTNYDHATLDEVAGKIASAMSPLGLSFKWLTDQGEGGTIKVTCVISHVMGYSESTPLQASPDQSGGKNNIQAIGSTVSYLQRYTLLAATGLAVSGQDNDGNTPESKVERISEEQALALHALITENEIDLNAVLRWLKKSLKCDSLENISVQAYETVLDKVRASIKRKKADENK